MGVKSWNQTDEDLHAIIDIYNHSFQDANPGQALQKITKHSTYKGFFGVKYVSENKMFWDLPTGILHCPGNITVKNWQHR
ncbi:hypothetical protein ACFS6F_07800 [Halobacillus naozhouensis]